MTNLSEDGFDSLNLHFEQDGVKYEATPDNITYGDKVYNPYTEEVFVLEDGEDAESLTYANDNYYLVVNERKV